MEDKTKVLAEKLTGKKKEITQKQIEDIEPKLLYVVIRGCI